jgi:hypothetical protein
MKQAVIASLKRYGVCHCSCRYISGEPKLFDSGNAWGVNEGPTNDNRRSSCHTHHIYSICLCGSIASHMRGAIDETRQKK